MEIIGIGNTGLEICKKLCELFPDKKSCCKIINTEPSDFERRNVINKFLLEIGESTLENHEDGKHFSIWGELRKSIEPINTVFIIIGVDGIEKLNVIQPVIEKILRKSVYFYATLYILYIFKNTSKHENYDWLKYFKKDKIDKVMLITFYPERFIAIKYSEKSLPTEKFNKRDEFVVKIVNELIEFILVGITDIKKIINTLNKHEKYRDVNRFIKYIEN